MTFLRFLEQCRSPVLDWLMQAVTELGGETVFLAVALSLLWCVDKRQGYYLMSVGFLGILMNQFLKITCQVPRPWVLDPAFTIVESARAGAGGYSFPSGHSQSAVGTFLTLARMPRLRRWKWVPYSLCLLIPFSRMYLGVHTPADVLVGAGISAVLVLALEKPFLRGNFRPVFWIASALGAAFVLYLECFPFPAGTDPENFASALKNAYTLFGAVLALTLVEHLDREQPEAVRFTVWYAQAAKVLGGLVLVLVILGGLKPPLNALFGSHSVTHFLRYGIAVLAAGILWPKTFPWFATWGRKEHGICS